MCIKKEAMPKVNLINNGGIIKNKTNLPKKNLYLKPVLSLVTENGTKNAKITVQDVLKNFGASTAENRNDIAQENRKSDTENVRLGTKAFIQIMLHATKCSSCDDIKCKKMKLVMSHYIQCTKLKSGQDCPLCRQLLRVVAEHALYLCPHRVGSDPKFPCPVPFCDVMRASAALQKKNSI